MSKTPRQDALRPPAPLPLIRKSEWWAIIGLLLVCVSSISFLLWRNNNPTSYTIQCAVVTPNGPVQTVNLKAHDVVVTDFGIIKTKEGIYIPTTNEICVIKKEED